MRIVSGIRPTGAIHLGNYLGAIKQWKDLQAENYCTFFVADLHGTAESYAAYSHDADTNPSKTKDLLHKLGIRNVEIESDHFRKIMIIYHELSLHVPIGWLKRMTQFKDKAQTEAATLALLAYPVLMAADIFHFEGTHIPVGDDQLQHLQLVNEIARVTNRPKVTPIIGEYPRIMSLTDGTKKMSKSNPNEYSRINVTDSADLIRDKIMKAKSASDITDNTPEMNNLRMIQRACGGAKSISPDMKVKTFKEELAELVIKELAA